VEGPLSLLEERNLYEEIYRNTPNEPVSTRRISNDLPSSASSSKI